MLAKTFFLLAAGCAAAYASDPVAVYARVDRVEMLPDSGNPETIQIWGVFVLPKPNEGSAYLVPVKGYFFFKLPDKGRREAIAEWSDLKSVAGTKQLVAFGMRYTWRAKVRPPDEKAANPDLFSPDLGLTKVRGRTDYDPVRSLMEFKD